jgi:hypothetical protein
VELLGEVLRKRQSAFLHKRVELLQRNIRIVVNYLGDENVTIFLYITLNRLFLLRIGCLIVSIGILAIIFISIVIVLLPVHVVLLAC